MLGFPLGILSAAGAGVGVAGDYELISTTVLGSATSSITFSSLGDYSSTYKHLQIRATGRATNAATGILIRMLLNADTGTNYTQHGLEGNGSSVSSFAATSQPELFPTVVAAASTTANVFTGFVVDLLDAYSTTKNTTMRSFNGTTGFNRVALYSGVWMNTASVNEITLAVSASGNFVAGSRFSLYGIKG